MSWQRGEPFLITYIGESGVLSYDDVALKNGQDVDVHSPVNASTMVARYPHAFKLKDPLPEPATDEPETDADEELED